MVKIGPQTINHISEQVKALLLDYQTDLDKAYMGMGDDPLSISLSVRVSPDLDGNKVETNMKFITGQVKDRISGCIDEGQLALFPSQTEGGFKARFPLTIYPPPLVGRLKLYGRLGW